MKPLPAHALDSLGHNLAISGAGRRQAMGSEGFTILDGLAVASVAPAPAQTPDAPSRAGRRALARRRQAAPLRRGTSRAERELEALQRQTGVLTHDFNNLLNIILAANEALAAQAPQGSQARELAEMSQTAAEKAAELLRRLSDLSAPAAEGAPPIDCDAAIVATAHLARLSVPASVAVAARAAQAPLLCRADRDELDRALLNLCINAGHAMPDGGALTLASRDAQIDAATADRLRLAPGRYAVLSVADTGVGMSPETLARATEPYFTTRGGRGGTGLGLASVRDFAERAGGRLTLASRPGRGTTATLYLPQA